MRFGIDRLIVAFGIATMLLGGSKCADASIFDFMKSSKFTATLTTTDATVTSLFEVQTDKNAVYEVKFSNVARGIAGTDQGKGKAQECYVGAQNISGTLTVGSLICQTASGSLTTATLAVAVDGTKINITAAGGAANATAWIANVEVIKNAEANIVTTSTTTTSTTTTSTTTTT